VEDWKNAYIEANGIRFHYVTAGEGPLILLLHGFPQYWYAWRNMILTLAKQYKVVALDMRGYGDTDKPSNVTDYLPEILANDIAAVVHALGFEKAHIVGHDWGGGVAWRTAINHPEVVDHLIVLNCPHPSIFAHALKSNFDQIQKSWYVFFFQIPYLPEWIMKPGPTLKKLFRSPEIRPGTFSDEDIAKYTAAFEKPGAFTAALNYYRAAFRKPKEKGKVPKISAPTLLIWGEKDIALGKELTYGMEDLFSGPFKIEYLPEGTHWVIEEYPEKVSQLILEFIK
jgi:pimeloyl-ACP methyl ester carboxylesterase